jgi:undecaprenyl diphosphate synthase
VNIPNHIAIIMDGNGRWAKSRGLKRTKGHEQGAQTIRTITEYAASHKEIHFLTLYAFSTENWKRPKLEVDFLMKLLEKYLESEKEAFIRNNIRFKAIGDRSAFSQKLQNKLSELEELTKDCTELVHSLALNYGSHDELIRSANAVIDKGEKLTKESLTEHLDITTDVDLLIRTGGDHRISNFLLWQSSYAELFFTETLWPDFQSQELEAIIASFKSIERRFGAIT